MNSPAAHARYLSYVMRHRWFVFVECCKLGIPWRGLVHDLSKFLPSEWFPYVDFFHGQGAALRNAKAKRDSTGYYKPTDTGHQGFDFAWLLHQKRNDHHWQWWCLPEDEGGLKVLPMSSEARREMLADWRGAGRAQGRPDTRAWYLANWWKLKLHDRTRAWVEFKLGGPLVSWTEDTLNDCWELRVLGRRVGMILKHEIETAVHPHALLAVFVEKQLHGLPDTLLQIAIDKYPVPLPVHP